MNSDPNNSRRSRLHRWTDDLINPRPHPELEAALDAHKVDVPVLWLLGKTGAGKSSVIQRLTGDTRAAIGNGFEPCTRTADTYDHPHDAPVMRFLDTRGLGESGYDATEDLAFSQKSSHLLLVLTRVDDTSQVALCEALKNVSTDSGSPPILHVHTALHTLDDEGQRQRAAEHNHHQITDAIGWEPPQVSVDFLPDGEAAEDIGLDALRSGIVDLVPQLADALAVIEARDTEHSIFLLQRKEILGYAAAAGAIDALPAVGLVGVPIVQGKLLHALAARYQLDWDRKRARDFLAVLGTTFLYRYGLSFIGRQVSKFIPVYGQTAGAAAAAGISFASTYALGRAACLYLYRQSIGQPVDRDTLQKAFREAFTERHTGVRR